MKKDQMAQEPKNNINLPTEVEIPNFIGKPFDPLDLLHYTHHYRQIKDLDLDVSDAKNKRFAYVESFYQYCMWHAYQQYQKTLKPIVDLCAAQKLAYSEKFAIFGGTLNTYIFDFNLEKLYAIATGELQLEFDLATAAFKLALVNNNGDFIDDSLYFFFDDDLGQFAENCNKRWNEQGDIQTGYFHNDYPIFSFFETVLLDF